MATLEEDIPATPEAKRSPLPGELPDITLSEDQRRELTSWITEELDREIRNRSEIEDEWKEIQTLYEATEIEDKKDYPWPGAATIMIQVIAQYVEESWAWMLGIVFAGKDVMSVEPKRPEFNSAKDPFKRFISWALREELGLEEVCSSLFMELAKLGTCVAKTIYTQEVRFLRIYDPSTGEFKKVREIIRDSPEVIRVPDADFFFPIESRSAEDCRWKAHRFRLSWARILDRKEDGRFEADQVDKIKGFYETQQTDAEKERSKVLGTVPSHIKEHEFFELWFEYALKTDAEDQEDTDEELVRLIATFHKESGTIVRIQHNWYPLQLDPFSVCQLIPREGMLWGIGVGRIGVPTQLEVSAMHCQRLDNQTVLNCIAYGYKPDSLIGGNIRLTPGVGIPLDDPKNDIIPLQLGQKFDSTLQEEEHTIKMFRDRIGIGKEVELGETSTNAIVRAQEARIKSNAILKGIRRFVQDIVEKALLLYQQHYPNGKIESLLGEEGRLIEEIFATLSPMAIYYGLGISVTATNSAVSKDLERQNKLAIFNLLVQYYERAVGYFMQTQNPNVPEPIKQISLEVVTSLGAYVRDLLDEFDIPGRERLIIEPEKFAQLTSPGVTPESLARDVINPGVEGVPSVPAG